MSRLLKSLLFLMLFSVAAYAGENKSHHQIIGGEGVACDFQKLATTPNCNDLEFFYDGFNYVNDYDPADPKSYPEEGLYQHHLVSFTSQIQILVSGINSYFANEVSIDPANASYPLSLDDAQCGTATEQNPFFGHVLSPPFYDSNYFKIGTNHYAVFFNVYDFIISTQNIFGDESMFPAHYIEQAYLDFPNVKGACYYNVEYSKDTGEINYY